MPNEGFFFLLYARQTFYCTECILNLYSYFLDSSNLYTTPQFVITPLSHPNLKENHRRVFVFPFFLKYIFTVLSSLVDAMSPFAKKKTQTKYTMEGF